MITGLKTTLVTVIIVLALLFFSSCPYIYLDSLWYFYLHLQANFR